MNKVYIIILSITLIMCIGLLYYKTRENFVFGGTMAQTGPLTNRILTVNKDGDLIQSNTLAEANYLQSLMDNTKTNNASQLKIDKNQNTSIKTNKNSINSINDTLQNLQEQINTVKQTYLKKGGFYQFNIRSNGGDGAMYSIDYWDRNGKQPGWVKNGRVTDKECANKNHRCVQLG